jgi:Leucine-rich repeat (LRR) protein
MQLKITSGSGAAGLGVIGTGLAYAFPDAKWIGLLLIAIGVLVFGFDIRFERGRVRTGRWRRLNQIGPWILIVCGPLIGLVWLYLQSPLASSSSADAQSALAHLAELGWSVKPGPDSIQFGIANGPLPPMKESAAYFGQLSKPYNLALQQVTGLDGLHYLSQVKGLTKIEIGAGGFTDISELKDFTELKTLTIGQLPLNGTATVDLAPLATMTSLETLVLSMVRAKSVEALAPLTKLKVLNLGQTLISDISPLTGLAQLENLEIRGTRVTDLGALKGKQQLKELMVGGAQLPGLADLVDLPSFKSVSIIEQAPIDLSAVGKLSKLENLFIVAGGSYPVSVASLGGLRHLRSLAITGTPFGILNPTPDIQSLGALDQLESLTLGYLQIGDIGFAGRFGSLSEITLNQLPIHSIDVLRRLKTLKKVTLVDVPVVDISPLLELPRLSDLRLIRVPARSDIIVELQKRGVAVD